MNNPILDDHLLEKPKITKKKEAKFKRPQNYVLVSFGRFFIAQIVMMLFVFLLGMKIK